MVSGVVARVKMGPRGVAEMNMWPVGEGRAVASSGQDTGESRETGVAPLGPDYKTSGGVAAPPRPGSEDMVAASTGPHVGGGEVISLKQGAGGRLVTSPGLGAGGRVVTSPGPGARGTVGTSPGQDTGSIESGRAAATGTASFLHLFFLQPETAGGVVASCKKPSGTSTMSCGRPA